MTKKTTILYVDDEEINLLLFEINMKAKFNILTAKSGTKGLIQIKENSDICVVISDMKMPEMNGLEFIKQAKKNNPNIHYFILTGFHINNEIEKALKEKLIINYFSKPLDINDITTTIIKCLK